jgi:hypothetical protein
LDFEKAYDKVQWSLKQTLQNKAFCEQWVNWISLAVETGKVCINFNGENGDYFRSFWGVRQGDPLSPILFDIIGDALGAIISAAKNAGHLSGLVPHLVDAGITHVQYAEDTVLFLDLSNDSITNMKFLLYCYEAISGLKINFQKREIFVFGVDYEEQNRVADMFNATWGPSQ